MINLTKKLTIKTVKVKKRKKNIKDQDILLNFDKHDNMFIIEQELKHDSNDCIYMTLTNLTELNDKISTFLKDKDYSIFDEVTNLKANYSSVFSDIHSQKTKRKSRRSK